MKKKVDFVEKFGIISKISSVEKDDFIIMKEGDSEKVLYGNFFSDSFSLLISSLILSFTFTPMIFFITLLIMSLFGDDNILWYTVFLFGLPFTIQDSLHFLNEDYSIFNSILVAIITLGLIYFSFLSLKLIFRKYSKNRSHVKYGKIQTIYLNIINLL